MTLEELTQRALAVRSAYAAAEASRYGRSWTREEVALGFVGDVGDLMKLVQAAEGVRTTHAWRHEMAHELADCLPMLVSDRMLTLTHQPRRQSGRSGPS